MKTMRHIVALSFVLAGCSASQSPEGTREAEPVAGGQSGTDSFGAYSCELDDAVATSIPLDEVVLSCSAAQSLDAIEVTRLFLCEDSDMSFTIDVERGTSAELLTGKLYSDTDPDAPPTDCQALRVAATTTIVADDGSVSFTSSQVTVDHLCASFSFDGKALRQLGCANEELTFQLLDDATRLFVVSRDANGSRTESCALLP